MQLFKFLRRIRNLWRLSAIEVSPKETQMRKELEQAIEPFVKKPKKMAEIIKRSNPVDEIVNGD